MGTGADERPNVLRVSFAASLDRDDYPVEICFQNRHDLGPRSGVSCTRRLGGRTDRAMNGQTTVTLPEITWHASHSDASAHAMTLSKPRQHTSAFESIGHNQTTLREIRPAQIGVWICCSSRQRCLRPRQHKKTFECITINCVSWTRSRSVQMPPNALPFSGAALIDRYDCWAESRLQNGPDLSRREAASAATACWAGAPVLAHRNAVLLGNIP